jgi:hypothetical protein
VSGAADVTNADLAGFVATKTRSILVLCGVFASLTLVWAGGDRPTDFTNRDGVVNTRHNLTFRDASGNDLLAANGGGIGAMASYRNDYREVCVYCHTPHAANASVAAPLWNRHIPNTTYTTYNELNTTTLTQTVYQPGAASLTCLSCHDGVQAVDAIMNMPGSGGYSATPNNDVFLDSWATLQGGNEAEHKKLNSNFVDGCLSCHQPAPAGTTKFATDFTAAAIGTDLRNDHPIGVTFPAATGTGTDWKTPASRIVNGQTVKFFDDTANGRMDKNEIRLYDSGNGPSVECASCHDPHGVPSAGAGSTFYPTFMRKSNVGSALCMTCHAK